MDTQLRKGAEMLLNQPIKFHPFAVGNSTSNYLLRISRSQCQRGEDGILVRDGQQHSTRVTRGSFIEETAQTFHQFQKRFAPLRFDADRIRTHQVVEFIHRQPIHTGTAFIDARIHFWQTGMMAQQDLGGLPGARKFGNVCMGERYLAQSAGRSLGLRPAPPGKVHVPRGIIVDAVGDIRFALAVTYQEYLHLKYFWSS